MSKLARMITAHTTGNRFVAGKPLRLTDTTYGSSRIGQDYATEYKIGVSLGARVILEDPGKEKEYAIYDLRRSIIEEVFGEFRPLIIEMREALYDRDDSRIKKLLAALEHKMFKDGL